MKIKIPGFSRVLGFAISVVVDGDGDDVLLDLEHGDVDRVDEALDAVDEDRSSVGDLNCPGADDPCFLEPGVYPSRRMRAPVLPSGRPKEMRFVFSFYFPSKI